MAKKKLITLAKDLDFCTEHEYFDYIIESEINGNMSQVRTLIQDMKKEDQKDFILYSNCYTTNAQHWKFLDIVL